MTIGPGLTVLKIVPLFGSDFVSLETRSSIPFHLDIAFAPLTFISDHSYYLVWVVLGSPFPFIASHSLSSLSCRIRALVGTQTGRAYHSTVPSCHTHLFSRTGIFPRVNHTPCPFGFGLSAYHTHITQLVRLLGLAPT